MPGRPLAHAHSGDRHSRAFAPDEQPAHRPATSDDPELNETLATVGPRPDVEDRRLQTGQFHLSGAHS